MTRYIRIIISQFSTNGAGNVSFTINGSRYRITKLLYTGFTDQIPRFKTSMRYYPRVKRSLGFQVQRKKKRYPEIVGNEPLNPYKPIAILSSLTKRLAALDLLEIKHLRCVSCTTRFRSNKSFFVFPMRRTIINGTTSDYRSPIMVIVRSMLNTTAS